MQIENMLRVALHEITSFKAGWTVLHPHKVYAKYNNKERCFDKTLCKATTPKYFSPQFRDLDELDENLCICYCD